VLVAAQRATSRSTENEVRLARAAMVWLFDLLPGEVHVCDAHLLGPGDARRARERYGLVSQRLPYGGITLIARRPEVLADFLCADARHDDALFIRPMTAAIAPDLQPWLRRIEDLYARKAIPRYSAVGLACLNPVSFEIVTSQAIPDFAERTASLATRLSVGIRQSAPPTDRNWPGWLAWLKSRFR
jgi:hypothetical protein